MKRAEILTAWHTHLLAEITKLGFVQEPSSDGSFEKYRNDGLTTRLSHISLAKPIGGERWEEVAILNYCEVNRVISELGGEPIRARGLVVENAWLPDPHHNPDEVAIYVFARQQGNPPNVTTAFQYDENPAWVKVGSEHTNYIIAELLNELEALRK